MDRPTGAPVEPSTPVAGGSPAPVTVTLAEAIDSVSDGFALWGPDDRLVLCNDSYRAILGKAAPYVQPGVSFEEMLHMVVGAGNIPMAIGREQAWIDERMRIHRAHGSLEYPTQGRWVLIREHPLPDGHVILTFTDVTALKEQAEQSRQRQRMDAMGQLTGGLAHDFNNLLTVILGNLQLAVSELESDSPAVEAISAALDAARHGAELNERLLAFARRQVLTPRATDVNRLIDGMSMLIRNTVPPTVTVDIQLGQSLWPTFIDAVQLQSAILNLTVNARDAMQDRTGRLTIATENAALGRNGEEEASDGEEYVAVTVTDTGSGIPDDAMPHVFDPFFTTKPRGKGTGLGLSMVFGFVTQSGGRIHIDSEPGRGTTVRLLLPRCGMEPMETVTPSQALPADALGEGTVLVTEDDPHVRRLTVKLLTSWGYTVIDAADAESALAALDEARSVDLLLTDILLDGEMDGFALARAVRERLPHVRILYMSGYVGSHEALHRRRATDRAPFIDKPFDFEDLRRAVRGAMAERP